MGERVTGMAGWELDELEVALRSEHPQALRDFYKHFRPLLLQHARLLGVERSVRDETVMTFIADMLLELPTRQLPSNLTGYVLTAFRYRVGALYRKELLDRSTSEADRGSDDGEHERPVELESCSAYSRRAASGDGADRTEDVSYVRAALRAFWRCVRDQLSSDDRALLALLRNENSGTDIASTLGIPPGTVRVRIHRLRVRVRTATAMTLQKLPPAEREHVEVLLRRSGLLEPGRAGASRSKRERAQSDSHARRDRRTTHIHGEER